MWQIEAISANFYFTADIIKEIAYFSYDENHEFHFDDRSISYYYPPRVPVNLCEGFEKFKSYDPGNEHLDSLLQTVIAHEEKTGVKTDTEVITWRGMMTKIMAAPYNDRDGFEMNATFYQGTVYIEENYEYRKNSQQRQMQQPTQPGRPSQQMMTYWGYKFEALSVLPDTWEKCSREMIEGREKKTVTNAAQYCSVASLGIGGTSLVIGGEVDALWEPKPDNPSDPKIQWVELKTSLDPRLQRSDQAFEKKLLKFWLQSFLLAVPKIIVGFRDHDGMLRTIQEIQTHSIPGRVKKPNGRSEWDGDVAVNFGANFLRFIKKTVVGDGVWRIRKRENGREIEIFKIEEAGHGKILTDEFINHRIKLSMRSPAKDTESSGKEAENPKTSQTSFSEGDDKEGGVSVLEQQ